MKLIGKSGLTYNEPGVSGADLALINDTIWATQKSISELFGVDRTSITKHLNNIFAERELDENSVCEVFAHTAEDGKPYQTKHYNLDAIISIGYRVNSQKATKFRIWATGVLKQYLKDGYVIDETVLRSDPNKLNKLAAKIRELRATEKNVFAQVRECFKISASDYEPTSSEVRSFYALLQDKFHHAITSMTASKLVLDRADFTADNMGLISFKELLPTKDEARTGKNYLTENEVYRMFLLSEQFLLFAESSALMGKQLTMSLLHKQLDNLLKLNGYPVFEGYRDYLKDKAMKHAEQEYEKFIDYRKLEMLGIAVDVVDYELGEYEGMYRAEIDNISMKELRNHFSENQISLNHAKP